MRVIIPCETAEGLLAPRSAHFGHAPFLTIVELDEDRKIGSVKSVKNAEHGSGGCGAVIAHVLGLGADAIICAGMGIPPLTRFTEGGIDVYVDRSHAYAKDALDLFCEGQLPRMTLDDACRH